MKKWTFPLLLLLTVLLLISLAFLPALAGELQDAGIEKTVSSRTLHSIVPYISEDGSGLRILDKLKILQECEVSSIVPAMASMTEEQVRTTVEAGLSPYMDAGIVGTFESGELQVTPYVAISWHDASHWFLYWEVRLVDTTGDIPRSLSIGIDDETGMFFMVHYFDPSAVDEWLLWEEDCLLLNKFAQIWLEQAGLWEIARPVTTDPDSQQMQGMSPAMRTADYVLYDGSQNPLQITFSVSVSGEYTMWIKSMSQ